MVSENKEQSTGLPEQTVDSDRDSEDIYVSTLAQIEQKRVSGFLENAKLFSLREKWKSLIENGISILGVLLQVWL